MWLKFRSQSTSTSTLRGRGRRVVKHRCTAFVVLALLVGTLLGCAEGSPTSPSSVIPTPPVAGDPTALSREFLYDSPGFILNPFNPRNPYTGAGRHLPNTLPVGAQVEAIVFMVEAEEYKLAASIQSQPAIGAQLSLTGAMPTEFQTSSGKGTVRVRVPEMDPTLLYALVFSNRSPVEARSNRVEVYLLRGEDLPPP